MTKKEMQKHEHMLVENAWEKAQQVWISAPERIDEFERLDYC